MYIILYDEPYRTNPRMNVHCTRWMPIYSDYESAKNHAEVVDSWGFYSNVRVMELIEVYKVEDE